MPFINNIFLLTCKIQSSLELLGILRKLLSEAFLGHGLSNQFIMMVGRLGTPDVEYERGPKLVGSVSVSVGR